MSDKATPRPPNQRELLFVSLLAADEKKNATKAAEGAGYSKHTAAQQATRLLRRVQIQELLAKAVADRAATAGVTLDRVLAELARIAFQDPGAMFNDEHEPIALKDMPEDLRRSIAGVEYEDIYETENGRKTWVGKLVKYKFWNKVAALERLYEHLAPLKPKSVEVTGKDGKPLIPPASPVDLSGLTPALLEKLVAKL